MVCIFTVLTLISVSAKTVTKNKLVYETQGNTATLVECKNNAKKITVPSKVGKYKVTAIGEWAFSEKKKLESVKLPSTLTSIGKAAFNECTSLKKIEIPSSVKKIGASAFWYCKNLESAVIPKSVKTIGKKAFYGCDKLTAYVVKGSKAEKYIKKQKNVTLAYRYMTSLTLSDTSLEVTVGDKTALKTVKKPQKLYNGKVAFSSSNGKVATVNAQGVVTAKAAGTAVITCKAKDGSGKKATCTVTVKAKFVSVVPVKPAAPDKVTGLKITDKNISGYTLSWKASDDCDGYIIKRYNPGSKKYVNAGKTDKTSYTFSSRPLSSEETYTVTAYSVKGTEYAYSEQSAGITASVLKTEAVKALKVTDVTEDSVSLSWEESQGATGYKLYFYDGETKQYEYKWSTGDTKATLKGLSPDSEYSFAVLSYARTAKESLDCTEYSDIVSVRTLPDKVRELRSEEELTYPDSLTLSWDGVSGADGYNLYIYNKETGTYELYKDIAASDKLTAEISGLDAGTAYYFKVGSYRLENSDKEESGLSKTFTFKTAYVPDNAYEASQSFIKAYSDTKKLDGSFTFMKSFKTEFIEDEKSGEYEDILPYLEVKETSFYEFENGTDTADGKTVSELIYPYGEDINLSVRDIDASSLKISDDGAGYSLSFAVKGDKALKLVSLPDFDKIAQEKESFILLSYKAGEGSVKATVLDGTFSSLRISVPVTVSFSYNSQRYETQFTLSQNYYFN